jgi:hypothetical protein
MKNNLEKNICINPKTNLEISDLIVRLSQNLVHAPLAIQCDPIFGGAVFCTLGMVDAIYQNIQKYPFDTDKLQEVTSNI